MLKVGDMVMIYIIIILAISLIISIVYGFKEHKKVKKLEQELIHSQRMRFINSFHLDI